MTSITRVRLMSAFGMAAILCLLTSPGNAQRAGADDEAPAAPQTTVDAATGKILTEAIELFNMENYAAAKARLADLRVDRLSPYERGRMEQLLAAIEYAGENYTAAREHLSAAIASGGLNAQEISGARYQLATFYVIEEKWTEAIAALEEWFRLEPMPNSSAYYMLAMAYYQQGDSGSALEPAKKAVELTDAPQEGWVQLVYALLVEEEDYEGAVPYLERLVTMAPSKKNYWMQLSSVYQQLENYPRALAAMQLAYSAGLLTEDSDIRRLADLLVYNNIPYRGAQILEKGIEDQTLERDAALYEKLANCWIGAGEMDKALPPLERAAQLADDGTLYVRLAEVHTTREDWPAAATALQSALGKGDLRDTQGAQLLMGVALYNQEQYREARPWFERARASERHRNMAGTYLQAIDSRVGR